MNTVERDARENTVLTMKYTTIQYNIRLLGPDKSTKRQQAGRAAM